VQVRLRLLATCFGSKTLRSWFGGSAGGSATQILSAPPTADIVAATQTDVGRVRQVNEDVVVFSRPASFREFQRRGAVALVADGMGGARGGNIASEIASTVIPEFYHLNRDEPGTALRKALLAANREIYRKSRKDRSLTGMGATCVVLAVSPSFAWAAWVGDSRLYLVRDNQIFQMTEDHSLVNEMVHRGLLTAEQAASHEDRNVVTRALGSHPKVDPSVWNRPYPVRIGDRYLLCSDGVHDPLSSAEILEIVREGAVENAAARLLAAANERGGHDNASAVLLELVDRAAIRAIRATRESRPWSEIAP
jgi:serine/threonine protein phosphatase PrpC